VVVVVVKVEIRVDVGKTSAIATKIACHVSYGKRRKMLILEVLSEVATPILYNYNFYKG